MDSTDIKIVFVSAPSIEVAKELAKKSIENAYAACTSIIPNILSIYYWDSKLQEEQEVQILFKTTANNIPELKKMILEEHPYECPEFIVIETSEVENRYASWIRNACIKQDIE